MHYIETQIYKFLEDLKTTNYKIPEELLVKFGNETQKALKKQFERERSPRSELSVSGDTPPRDFKLSMSNVGRPLCTLQMEKEHGSRVGVYDINKFLFGELVEDTLFFLIYASGLNVEAEQKKVILKFEGHEVSGTLDIIIDGKVYDVKSASDYSFKTKMNNTYEHFVESDAFGYHAQLFGYAKADNKKAGGFILQNKSTGEIGVLEVPDNNYQELEDLAMCKISYNLDNFNQPFARSFEAVDEYFKKKWTGNKVLNKTCGFCAYKFECWDDLQCLPQAKSTAKNTKMIFYVEHND